MSIQIYFTGDYERLLKELNRVTSGDFQLAIDHSDGSGASAATGGTESKPGSRASKGGGRGTKKASTTAASSAVSETTSSAAAKVDAPRGYLGKKGGRGNKKNADPSGLSAPK